MQETDDAEKLQESDGKETDDQNEEAIKEQTSENSIIKKNADAINYVIVESPYLETPGTERIAVSYGDGSENISDATLTVRDDEGQETIWDLSVSADQLYLFTYEYTDEWFKEQHNYCGKIAVSWYVVEEANIDGIVIWQDSDGTVYQTMPNSECKAIANSLMEYISE